MRTKQDSRDKNGQKKFWEKFSSKVPQTLVGTYRAQFYEVDKNASKTPFGIRFDCYKMFGPCVRLGEVCVSFASDNKDVLSDLEKAIRASGFEPHPYTTRNKPLPDRITRYFIPSWQFAKCYSDEAVWDDAIKWMIDTANKVVENYYKLQATPNVLTNKPKQP